jgi:glycosyltransferase involved in cell wall biosynthesis
MLRAGFRMAGALRGGLPAFRGLRALAGRAAEVRSRLLGAAALACPGEFLREMLERNGYPPGAVAVAPHGIEAPGRLCRRTPLAEEEHLRVGYVGPLQPHKGAHLPIDALARLGAGVPVRLTYRGAAGNGEGYARDVLRRIAAEPRAVHAGPYAYAQVGDVLAGLDVLVVPSLWYENTPTIIYEALAAGVPVIASDLGGLRELVGRYGGGWLFPRGDVGSLAALLGELAADREAVRRRAAEIRPVPAFAEHLAYWLRVYQAVR